MDKLVENEVVKYINIISKQEYKKHIGRYTEGSLVKKLEDFGIGRPSTYNAAVSNIVSNNTICPTVQVNLILVCITSVKSNLPCSIKGFNLSSFTNAWNLSELNNLQDP